MRLLLRLLCAGVFATALAAVTGGVAGAAAPTTTCNGALAPGTYQRVVVPAGGTCLSDGPVTIRGGLFVGSGATFVLGSEENPVNTGMITGGVHATDAASVQIHFTTINGGIDVQGGSGPFGGPFGVTWTTIEDSRINGAVTNTIHGSLNCAGNSPAPQVGDSEGAPNNVTGAKTGQCSSV